MSTFKRHWPNFSATHKIIALVELPSSSKSNRKPLADKAKVWRTELFEPRLVEREPEAQAGAGRGGELKEKLVDRANVNDDRATVNEWEVDAGGSGSEPLPAWKKSAFTFYALDPGSIPKSKWRK